MSRRTKGKGSSEAFERILWSPFGDEFVCSDDSGIRLCEYDGRPLLSDGSGRINVVTSVEIAQPRCLAWSPSASRATWVAVGTASGSVPLVNLTASGADLLHEFVPPGQPRACRDLSWNKTYRSFLAAGYELHKYEHCCHVWDMNVASIGVRKPDGDGKGGRSGQTPRRAAKRAADADGSVQSLLLKEGAVAVEFDPSNPTCLAIGTAYKWLRMFDLRSPSKTPTSVVCHDKEVRGVLFDPHAPTRFATFSEKSIKLWDMRRFPDALMTVNASDKVLQIAWSPTRPNCLVSLVKSTACVQLWDLENAQGSVVSVSQKSKRAQAEVKPRILRTSEPPACLAWHPTVENMMITLSHGKLEQLSVGETIGLAWSPANSVCVSNGHSVQYVGFKLDAIDSTGRDDIVDISDVMRERAVRGYALDIDQNKALCSSFVPGVVSSTSDDLVFLWWWMGHVSRPDSGDGPAAASGTTPSAREFLTDEPFEGLLSVFREAPASTVAPARTLSSSSAPPLDFTFYSSPARSIALQMCDWKSAWPVEGVESAVSGLFTDFVESKLKVLEANGEFEHAAALALFHLDLRRAIAALNRDGAPSHLRLVAMSLSGYQAENGPSGEGRSTSLWREMCLALKGQFDNPYPPVDGDDFSGVLEEPGISLVDKIGFACCFLSDSALLRYLNSTAEALISAGSLSGILLTGLSEEGIALFQGYVDKTSDIQTAALATAHAVPHFLESPQAHQWLEVYRSLLDQWRLWHLRARLDVSRSAVSRVAQAVPQQVYARCNGCNNSLSHLMIAPSKLRAFGTGQVGRNSQRPKVTSCPSCRKPLPRCELCLLHLGCTASANSDSKVMQKGTTKPQPGSANFESWFAWCQSCRHGGHAQHLLDWFKVSKCFATLYVSRAACYVRDECPHSPASPTVQSHTECPVSDCACECVSLDRTPVEAGSVTSS